jgi:hypothetical protein
MEDCDLRHPMYDQSNSVFLTAATLGIYIVELTKRIEIVINLDPKCYDETGFCSVPFVVTA